MSRASQRPIAKRCAGIDGVCDVINDGYRYEDLHLKYDEEALIRLLLAI